MHPYTPAASLQIANTDNPSDATLTTNQRVCFRTRGATALSFAVPLVRPAANNLPCAFDVQPSGTGLFASTGYSWFDACDSDVVGGANGDANADTNTGRLGAHTDHTYVGSFASNVSNSKAFWITAAGAGGGNGQVPLIKLSRASGGVRTADDQSLATDPNVIFSGGGSVVASAGYRLPANAVNGFLYMPRINGTPTGTPASYGKSNPICFDESANKIWIYNTTAAAWKSVVVA